MERSAFTFCAIYLLFIATSEALRKNNVGSTERLFVTGASDDHGIFTFLYNTSSGNDGVWSGAAQMNFPRHMAGVAAVDGRVFVVGGQLSTVLQYNSAANVERYDCDRNTWTSVAPMRYKRKALGLSVLNGQLYAFGGQITADIRSLPTVVVLDKTELYDPKTNRWQTVDRLPEPRTALAGASVGGCAYAMGGLDRKMLYTNTVFKYCLSDGYWTDSASMKVARSQFGAAVLKTAIGDKLYACGGSNLDAGQSCERYYPELNSWFAIGDTSKPIARFGMTSLGRKLLVAGGFQLLLSQVSKDVVATEAGLHTYWIAITKLPVAINNAGAVVVKC